MLHRSHSVAGLATFITSSGFSPFRQAFYGKQNYGSDTLNADLFTVVRYLVLLSARTANNQPVTVLESIPEHPCRSLLASKNLCLTALGLQTQLLLVFPKSHAEVFHDCKRLIGTR